MKQALGMISLMLTSLFLLQTVYAQTTYVYKENDGTVWFGDATVNNRIDNLSLIGIYGRPPAVKSCGKSSETLLNVKALNYLTSIKNAAQTHNIDFRLIKAMIKTESCFNHKAVSSVGAKGLMQLMPKTAESMGVRQPFNAEQNIKGGTKYFRWLLNEFKQDLSLALAAYNAGPTAVRKYARIPPYNETQKYVKKVLAAYRGYIEQKQ